MVMVVTTSTTTPTVVDSLHRLKVGRLLDKVTRTEEVLLLLQDMLFKHQKLVQLVLLYLTDSTFKIN